MFKKLVVLLIEPSGGLLLTPSPALPPSKSDSAPIPLRGQWRAVCAAELLFTSGCRSIATAQALLTSVSCIALWPPGPQKSPATYSLQHPLVSLLEWETEVQDLLMSLLLAYGVAWASYATSLFFTCNAEVQILSSPFKPKSCLGQVNE